MDQFTLHLRIEFIVTAFLSDDIPLADLQNSAATACVRKVIIRL